jgi:outer membrane immunogenic protein
MKKTMLLFGALVLATTAVYAQESRQDVSISATAAFAPHIDGGTGVHKDTTTTLGALASYRYMLTPRSALEVNYSYAQNSEKYITSHVPDGRIHTLQQEISGAYVYNLNFKNFSPFAEVGVGGMIFTPIKDSGTNQLDAKQNTNIGALFGAGVAYELSPSFDIRAEYRGFVVKTPDFGLPGDIFKTNRYEVVSTPSIGIAYHF